MLFLLHGRRHVLAALLMWLLATAGKTDAQDSLAVYTDSLVNGFDDWSYTTHSLTNNSPVHSGSQSISVTPGNYQAISFHHADLNTTLYTNFSFWAHGGTGGGQLLQVDAELDGVSQGSYPLPTALTANAWQQFTIPLSTLGVADKTNFSRINIQFYPGPNSTFYLDDIQFGPKAAPALIPLIINATQAVRTVDSRWFGVNVAAWDGDYDTSQTVSLMNELGTRLVRLPGGSLSDEYHWGSNTTLTNTWTWNNSFSNFVHVITNASVNAQTIITVNYGTGTPTEAAAWVRNANVTNHFAFKYWEVGNENYGTWETDTNVYPHDGYTYAVRAATFMAQMKAVDPTIKIGVPVVTGEGSSINGYTNHPIYNARTGQTNYGWTPVVLATLKSLGTTPDFLVYHFYPEYLNDSDLTLLQDSANWVPDAADLRQQITDYFGTGGTNIELLVTENNADSGNQGRQSTSIVNGLYYADSLGQVMQTEFNSFVWWDFRNGTDTSGDFNALLYGWRNYGDLGMVNGPTNRDPVFYAAKLMAKFAGTNDTVVKATSSYSLLAAYAVRHVNGSVSVLALNKDSSNSFNGQIQLNGFTPGTIATINSYGIPQDEATRTNAAYTLQDLATNSFTVAGTNFTYSFPPYSLTMLTLIPTAPNIAVLPATNGQFILQVYGQPNVRYVMQTSTDLRTWAYSATNTLSGTTWNATNSISSPSKFWRAVWLP